MGKRWGRTKQRADRRAAVPALLAAATLLTALIAPAHGAVQRNVAQRGTSKVASGVVLKKVIEPGPNRVKVLIIDPAVAGDIDVALARPGLGGYARTSSIAMAHNALAAINGDFGLSPGRPGHLFAMDGELVQTTLLGADGKNFAISADETRAWAASPQVDISLFEEDSQRRWTIDRWNKGGVTGSQVAAYSDSGVDVAPPPRSACSARLLPAGGMSLGPNDIGVVRNYTVDAMDCQASSMALQGGVVIAAAQSGSGSQNIRGLARGETVRLTWSLGWAGVLDSMGGSPILLHEGRVQVSNCNTYLCQVHPRTAVGITSSGKIIFMVVDGRRSGYSVGMNLVQLANEMKKFGAVEALNLDGGGSTTMWIRGKGVVNRPSDGGERSVTNALLLLPRDDSGDPNVSRPVVTADVELDPNPEAAPPTPAAAPRAPRGWLDYEASVP